MAARIVLLLLAAGAAGCMTTDPTSGDAPLFVETHRSEAEDLLEVIRATGKGTWRDLALTVGAPLEFRLNDGRTETLENGETKRDAQIPISVAPGDVLRFCSTGQSRGTEITLSDTRSEATLGAWSFASIAPC